MWLSFFVDRASFLAGGGDMLAMASDTAFSKPCGFNFTIFRSLAVSSGDSCGWALDAGAKSWEARTSFLPRGIGEQVLFTSNSGVAGLFCNCSQTLTLSLGSCPLHEESAEEANSDSGDPVRLSSWRSHELDLHLSSFVRVKSPKPRLAFDEGCGDGVFF